MTDSPCTDCGVEVLPVDEDRAEWFMVTDAVWTAAGMPRKGFLCVGCLEVRIGRRLTHADFTDCPVNDLTIADVDRYAWSYRTPRLTYRLQGPCLTCPTAQWCKQRKICAGLLLDG